MKATSALAAFLLLTACGSGGNEGCNPAFPYESNCFGSMEIAITDQNNSPVSGAQVTQRLDRAGESDYAVNTQAGAGRFMITGMVLDYHLVTVTAPAGYTVPSSQPNPVRVNVLSGRIATVNFKLFKN